MARPVQVGTWIMASPDAGLWSAPCQMSDLVFWTATYIFYQFGGRFLLGTVISMQIEMRSERRENEPRRVLPVPLAEDVPGHTATRHRQRRRHLWRSKYSRCLLPATGHGNSRLSLTPRSIRFDCRFTIVAGSYLARSVGAKGHTGVHRSRALTLL